MGLSPKQQLGQLTPLQQADWLNQLDEKSLTEIARDEWWWTARPEQHPPPGNWIVWLIRAGRGYGKTRSGSEWIIQQATLFPLDRNGHPTNWLIIGETLADTRALCIEGPSGILAVLRRRGIRFHYTKAPKPEITLLDHEQKIYFTGAENADVGRGHNLAGAWLDEIAKWRYAKAIWTEGILLSLRAPLVGGRPRAIVTSTPKPIPLLKEWDKRWRDGDHFIHITSGSTFENVDNLSAEIVAEFKNEYEGTSLGRQELYGQLLQEVDGALWTQANIDNNRIKPSALPDLSMTIVGVDPSGTGQGDEMGLVAAGQGVDGNHYVLADWSVKMAGRPAARRVWQLFEEVNADLVIYEDNLGKEWLRTVLQDAYKEFQNEGVFPPGGIAPMRPVTAVKGKKLRAQPTAMRYEQNRVKHVGEFVELEAQMTSWVPEEQIDSPDRVDALVHAQAYLRQRERGRATIAVPKGFRAS